MYINKKSKKEKKKEAEPLYKDGFTFSNYQKLYELSKSPPYKIKIEE